MNVKEFQEFFCYRVGDFANAFRQVYKLDKQPTITGLRLSEKLHESMISKDESTSLKGEGDLHYVLEPGVIHNYKPESHGIKNNTPGAFSYDSGNSSWTLKVDALTEEIKQWADGK